MFPVRESKFMYSFIFLTSCLPPGWGLLTRRIPPMASKGPPGACPVLLSCWACGGAGRREDGSRGPGACQSSRWDGLFSDYQWAAVSFCFGPTAIHLENQKHRARKHYLGNQKHRAGSSAAQPSSFLEREESGIQEGKPTWPSSLSQP